MTTNYHTAVSTGAAANASVINSPLSALDTAISQHGGGANVTNAVLRAWTEAGSYQMTSITYHGTYTNVVSYASVTWPDGSVGTYTSTTINTTWQAVDAYTITHATSGLTVTQAAVTRNAAGNITTKPALTIA